MPRYGDKVYQPARPLGDREPHPEAPGRESGASGAGGRGSRHPAGAQRDRLDRGAASMSPGTVHQRLVERSLAGKYDLFLGVGGGLAILGSDPLRGARSGETTPRGVAALPRQLALLHRARRRERGLRGGAEDHQRQVVGADHPLRRGVGRLPAGLADRPGADLHPGLPRGLRADGSRGPRHDALEGSVALVAVHVRAARGRARAALLGRLEADPGRSHAGHVRHPLGRGSRAPLAVRAVDPGLRRHAALRAGPRGPAPPARAALRGALRARLHPGGVRRDHGAPAALVLQPAGRLLLHGLVPGRPTCCSR